MRGAKSSVPPVWRGPPVRLSPRERRARLARRDRWLGQVAPAYLLHCVSDFVPGIYFFVKNRDGEMMYLNRSNRSVYGIADEADVVGMTDFDLNPRDLAQGYVQDDASIYATGKPILNRVELWSEGHGLIDWFVVNKMPIRSRAGKIVGIMGFLQSYERRAQMTQFLEGVSRAVDHIRRNHQHDITVEELARIASLSPRQLQRKFKESFGVGPQRFLIKTRLLAACRALRDTDLGMAAIAAASGFADQSGFDRHFRRLVGMTPTAFRRQTKSV
jgi:AraC-like DNA-binding protein